MVDRRSDHNSNVLQNLPAFCALLCFDAEQGLLVPRHVGVSLRHVWLRRVRTRRTLYEFFDADGRRKLNCSVFPWRGIRAENSRYWEVNRIGENKFNMTGPY